MVTRNELEEVIERYVVERIPDGDDRYSEIQAEVDTVADAIDDLVDALRDA